VETHHLEAEICDCNESITELRNTIRDLIVSMERSVPLSVPEYRGMPIFSPSTTSSLSSPLQLFRGGKLQCLGVKKMQRRLLEQLDDILQVAFEVSMPSLKEEESKEPIERQRPLSPGSERKISQLLDWSKPTRMLRWDSLFRTQSQKIDNVVRMQNTIRYSEKI
jgi:serine/threonine-protein kinase RIM15